MNITEALSQIQSVATANQNRSAELKVKSIEGKVDIGECYRQGDIYVFRVSDDHPIGNELKGERQLVKGNSSGSRHILVGDFKIYQGVEAPDCVGEPHSTVGLGVAFDVFTEARNNHPEHDDFILPTGRYQVIHQIDLTTLEKVAD